MNQQQSSLARTYERKLLTAIEDNRAGASNLVERIQDEMPRDRLQHSRRMEFELVAPPVVRDTTKGKVKREVVTPGVYGIHMGSEMNHLHSNAFSQVADRVKLPNDFIDSLELEGEEGAKLVVDNLNRLHQLRENKRLLVRDVKYKVRGVLSDRFRILDSRPIVDAFVQAAIAMKAQPYEGYGSDTRFTLRAVIPRVWEPIPNEVISIGIALANSDYGNGALSLRVFLLRCWCLNLATTEELLREVHLGSRLTTAGIAFSREAIEADTKAMVLATRDIVKGVFTDDKMQETLALVTKAHDQKIADPKTFFKTLQSQMKLLKGEVEEVQSIYNDGGVEELPPGNTLYRMSNALSWVAKNKATTPDRRMFLETKAGELLTRAAAA